MRINQKKSYKAPKAELVEISPITVLCESSVTGGKGSLFQFGVGTTGQWT